MPALQYFHVDDSSPCVPARVTGLPPVCLEHDRPVRWASELHPTVVDLRERLEAVAETFIVPAGDFDVTNVQVSGYRVASWTRHGDVIHMHLVPA